MKCYKLLPALLAISIMTGSLSGCGITIATVAGVTAYSLSKSAADSQSLTELLHKNIQNSNLVTTILGENLILAGQVNNESSINQAKILIAKQNEQLTVYSYAKIAPIETEADIQKDAELSKQINSILSESKLKSSAVVSDKVAYLLFDKDTSSKDIDHITKNILKIPDIKSTATLKP